MILEDLAQYSQTDHVIVSPDVGGLVRARSVAKQFKDSDIAIVDKRRHGVNKVEVMNIIGEVKGKDCFIIDDIVDTAGTLCKAADFLKQQGAKRIIAYCTHPVLSGNALSNLEESPIDILKVSNSIPLHTNFKNSSKIEVLDIGPLLAETLHRISLSQSA